MKLKRGYFYIIIMSIIIPVISLGKLFFTKDYPIYYLYSAKYIYTCLIWAIINFIIGFIVIRWYYKMKN